MTDLEDSEIQVCLPKNMFLIMNKLSEDDQRIIEGYIDKTETMYKTELANLKKKVEELEKNRDVLLIEKNELQKDKDRLLEEHMKAFQENMEELQKMTSRILNSQDARIVLKNIKFMIGSQTNTEITWKNNQITDSEINANSNVLRESSSEGTPKNDHRGNNESEMKNQGKSAFNAKKNSKKSGFPLESRLRGNGLNVVYQTSEYNSIKDSTINGVPLGGGNRLMNLNDEEKKLVQNYRKKRSTGNPNRGWSHFLFGQK